MPSGRAGAQVGQRLRIAALSGQGGVLDHDCRCFGVGAACHQLLGDPCQAVACHVQRGTVRRQGRPHPFRIGRAFRYTWRGEQQRPSNFPSRQRALQFSRRPRCCGDAGNNFELDARGSERIDLFLGAAEQHRIAAFKAHDALVVPGRVDELLIDDLLSRRWATASLADRNQAGVRREREHVRVYQCIVEHAVRFGEQPCSTQRKKVQRPRAGTDQINLPGQRIMPAATVALVSGSIRMNAPVARLWV